MEQNLKERLKTAGFLAAPLLILLISSSFSKAAQLLLVIIACLALLTAAWEFSRTCSQSVKSFQFIFYLLICIVCPLLATLKLLGYFRFSQFSALEFLAISFYLNCLLAGGYAFVLGRSKADHANQIIRELSIGSVLLGFCGTSLILTLQHQQGILIVFWMLLVVVANDTMAYFGGRHFGGEKLNSQISPNKTISGACSGILSGLLVGLIFQFMLPSSVSWLLVTALAVAVGFSSQLGDLAKSYIKRLHQVKDFGVLLPGHGGVLDRIDGVLAAAPWALILLSLI